MHKIHVMQANLPWLKHKIDGRARIEAILDQRALTLQGELILFVCVHCVREQRTLPVRTWDDAQAAISAVR